MPFTTTQLAAQINNTNFDAWIITTPLTQTQAQVTAFTTYFTNLQAWITNNGGANPFGWQDVTGLTHNNGTPVVLIGPQGNAPFDDAFDQVRTHLGTAGFRLFQAAEASKRLIRVLINLN